MSSNGTAQTNSQTRELPNLGPRFLEHHSGFSNFFKQFLVPSHPACGSCFKNGMLPIAVTKELLMLKGQQFTIIYKRSLGWLLKGSECQAARQPSTKLWVGWICYHGHWCPRTWLTSSGRMPRTLETNPTADFLPWFLCCIFWCRLFRGKETDYGGFGSTTNQKRRLRGWWCWWCWCLTTDLHYASVAVWRPSHLKLIHSASSCLSGILYQFLMLT